MIIFTSTAPARITPLEIYICILQIFGVLCLAPSIRTFLSPYINFNQLVLQPLFIFQATTGTDLQTISEEDVLVSLPNLSISSVAAPGNSRCLFAFFFRLVRNHIIDMKQPVD